jgi:hypothetical protein
MRLLSLKTHFFRGFKHRSAAWIALVLVLSLELPLAAAVQAQSIPRGTTGDLWADLVLGQPNFQQLQPDQPSNTGIFNAGGVVVDTSSLPNKLYVWDAGNSRILGFSDISHFYPNASLAGQGYGADMVLGQPDFTHTACNGDSNYSLFQNFPTPAEPNASCLCGMPQNQPSPREGGSRSNMAVDNQGNLYVPDFWNNRILRYDHSTLVSGATGVAASHVWGQGADTTGAAFTTGYRSCGPPSATDVCFGPGANDPGIYQAGVGTDSQGSLWVCDTENNRVLRFPFDPVAGIPAATADMVLGQGPDTTSFNTNQGATSASDLTRLAGPVGVRVDAQGNVYVIDAVGAPNPAFPGSTTTGRLMVY